jgi:A/G-specific adenine glycosylase
VAVLIDQDDRVLLVRRPARGLLAALWAFPEAELKGKRDARAAVRAIARTLALTPVGRARALQGVRHAFTHLRARYQPVLLRTAAGGPNPTAERMWLDPSRLGALAIPNAQLRIAELAALALAGSEGVKPKRPTIRLDRSAAR